MQFPNEPECHTKLLQHHLQTPQIGTKGEDNRIGDARSPQNKFDGSLSAASWHANIICICAYRVHMMIDSIWDWELWKTNMRNQSYIKTIASGIARSHHKQAVSCPHVRSHIWTQVFYPYAMAVTATCISSSFKKQFQITTNDLRPHQVYGSAILIMTQRISNRHPSLATLGEWAAHYMVIYCWYMSSVPWYRTFSWKPHVWVICWGRHHLPPEQGVVSEQNSVRSVSLGLPSTLPTMLLCFLSF